MIPHTMRESSKMKSTVRRELSKTLLLGVILALASQLAAEEPVGEKGALSAGRSESRNEPAEGALHQEYASATFDSYTQIKSNSR